MTSLKLLTYYFQDSLSFGKNSVLHKSSYCWKHILFVLEKYEEDAQKLWERFYRRNGVNFFKDRHYLVAEFPELTTTADPLILEVGCGVGNGCFPLLEELPQCQICAVDFSSKAVELLKQHPQYNPSRMQSRTLDLTEAQDFSAELNFPEVDFCLMIFVLSAISPDKMPQVVRNTGKAMKTGAQVLFRDYAVGDLAQQRFEQTGRQKKLEENFYLRGDGTRCYYFSESFLRTLFEREGFRCEKLIVYERQIENKGQEIVMDRKWIQAVFKKLK